MADDDAAPTSITLTVNDDSMGEGDGATTITVTAAVDGTTRFVDARTVRVSVSDSETATAVDFAAVSAFDIEIDAGAASGTGTFTLTPTDDAVDETDETITVSGVSGSLTVNSDTISLIDDDAAPTLSINSPSVTEGDDGSATLTYTVTLDEESGKQITVKYADAGTGTATSGTDYTAITGGTLTFAAGTTSQTFDVSVMGDVLDESNETILVSLSAPTNAVVSTTAGTGTGTITDNDATPTSITLTVSDNSVGEGDGATTITVTATVDGTTRFVDAKTVRVSVSDSETATAVDFAAVPAFDIGIDAGAASGTGTFTLTPTDDAVDETDETITVSGVSGSLTVNSDTITLADDDAAPTSITLTVNDNSVGEGDGATTITVTAAVDGSTRFVDARTVRVSVSDSGTATAVDFAAVTAFDIEIDAGAASGTGTFTLTPTDDAVDETDETITVSGVSGSLTVNSATISLTDDDGTPTSITLTVDDNSVAEGDGATPITVTATVNGTTWFAEAKTVRVSVAGSGTATAVDFAAVTAFDIEIDAGTASGTGTFTLTPTDDAVDETDETVTVSGVSGSLTVSSDTISLTDDDGAPTSITLTVDDDAVGEGDGATLITVTATVNGATRFAEAKTVRVSVTGSGTATAVDFAAVTAFDIEIAAGAASHTGSFTLTPTDDTVDETDETITVRGASSGLTVNPDTITLMDDDGTPSLSINSPSVAEGDNGAKNLTFTVTLSPASSRQVTVDWAGATGGTATSGTDYTAFTGGTLTFAAETASQNFNVSVTGDRLDEADETILVTLSNASGAPISTATGTGTITDDDATPTSITLTVDDNSVGEGDGGTAIRVTATVDGATRFADSRTVRVRVLASGSVEAVDFAAVEAFDIEIAAGAASGTGSFTLRPVDDTMDEIDEVITVSGVSGSLTVNPDTITLTDDDGVPSLSINSPSVAEGDSGSKNLTFTVTLSEASGWFVAVRYADAGTGTAASGTDYAAIAGGRLIFPVGTTSREITVSVAGDTTAEPDETVVVSLSDPTNAAIGTGTGTGTIADDDHTGDPGGGDDPDTPPTLSINSPSVAEGNDGSVNLTFTVALSAASTEAVTVDYADAGTGTATPGTDYTAITGGTLTFPAGTTSRDIAVSVMGDTTVEPDETVVVSLGNPANATLGTGTGTGTITNDDDAGEPGGGDDPDTPPSLSINSPSVAEGNDGSVNLTFTVALSAASTEVVTVDYADAGTGTATPGTDYTAITGSKLTFPAGTTSRDIRVSVIGDTTVEPDETVVVSLGNPANATIGTGTGTGTITNDDDAGDPGGGDDPDTPPTLSINSPSVAEGNDGSVNLTFTVALSAASTEAVTVDYADAGTGTATPEIDYMAITGGTLTFAAGTTSQTFDVSVAGDTTDEADETVVVTLSDAGNATIGTATGTGTITDDDAAPTLLIDSPTVMEGDNGSVSLTYTVALSAASGRAVTVDYADAGTGTATPGTDYAAIGAGTLTFEPGDTGKVIAVLVAGDVLDEPDETVVVALSRPSNATLGTASGVGTITDDDVDLMPSFGSATIPDQSWTQNRAITALTLPSATGGDGTLIHELAPAPPEGVAFDPVTREVSGTPTVSAERTMHTWRATDADGDTAELTFAITVVPDRVPEFTDGVAAQRYPVGVPIVDPKLPAATGGDGTLTYALTPEPPEGLHFDAATRELSGTPTEAMEATEYRLTATDEDGDTAALSFDIEVADPITISIADAQAVEGEPVEFGITLSVPVPEAVTVVWRISDGTARAHSDYAPPGGQQGELTIRAGQSTAVIVVPTTDDDLAEGEETFTVTLGGASRTELGDGEATGRIVDDDLEPTRDEALQWSLAAFGRTVATDAVDAVGQRFRAGEPDARFMLGGRDMPPRAGLNQAGAGWTTDTWRDFSLGGPAVAGSPGGFSGFAGSPGDLSGSAGTSLGASRTMRPPPGTFGPKRSAWDEFLSHGAFETSFGARGDNGKRWTLWGLGSMSRFSGRSGDELALDGEVRTGYLGADARLADRGLLLGVALSHSVGELSYRGAGTGLDRARVDVDLNSVLPYGHWALNERGGPVGAAGHRRGEGEFDGRVRSRDGGYGNADGGVGRSRGIGVLAWAGAGVEGRRLRRGHGGVGIGRVAQGGWKRQPSALDGGGKARLAAVAATAAGDEAGVRRPLGRRRCGHGRGRGTGRRTRIPPRGLGFGR